MRLVLALSLTAATIGRARADELGVEAVTEARTGGRAALAIGAGQDGTETLSLVELRAGVTAEGAALELGGRIRWRGTELVREDWDDTGDWLGIVRRLELAYRGDRVAAALGAGHLSPVAIGGLVDEYARAALIDQRAPGAITRVLTRRVELAAVVDDVTMPGLVASRLAVRVAAPWWIQGAVAIDPGTGTAMAPARGAAELGIACRLDPFELSASAVGAGREEAALVAAAAVRGSTGPVTAMARLELRGFTGPGSAAPIGPLWIVEREDMALDDEHGVGTALAAGLAIDGVGTASASLRTRGARGDVITARVTVPTWRILQAGAYAALGTRAAIAAAELRAAWSERWFSRLEAGRGYRRDEAGMLAPVWQVSAWFGVGAGW